MLLIKFMSISSENVLRLMPDDDKSNIGSSIG